MGTAFPLYLVDRGWAGGFEYTTWHLFKKFLSHGSICYKFDDKTCLNKLVEELIWIWYPEKFIEITLKEPLGVINLNELHKNDCFWYFMVSFESSLFGWWWLLIFKQVWCNSNGSRCWWIIVISWSPDDCKRQW